MDTLRIMHLLESGDVPDAVCRRAVAMIARGALGDLTFPEVAAQGLRPLSEFFPDEALTDEVTREHDQYLRENGARYAEIDRRTVVPIMALRHLQAFALEKDGRSLSMAVATCLGLVSRTGIDRTAFLTWAHDVIVALSEGREPPPVPAPVGG